MTVEDFSIAIAGVRVGSIHVSHDGDEIRIASRVDSNGRGAKLDERLRLDAKGIPSEWRISGTSLAGGTVDEAFFTEGGSRYWSNQSEEGSLTSDVSAVYVPADASAFAAWVYTRAALAAGGSVPILPSGAIRAAPLRQIDLADGGAAPSAQVFVVSGATLTPQYVFLDADQRLVAVGGGGQSGHSGLVLRVDLLAFQASLTDLITGLTLEHLAEIQSRVVHRYEVPIRVSNVRIFDPGTRRLSELASVTFFGERITAVQPQDGLPAGRDEMVIDGDGGTLLAGLHDMHAHLDGWCGLSYIAAGVTSVRDMGNENELLLDLQKRFDRGDLAGPTVVRSGFIEGRSRFSMALGVIPETLDEALEVVRWYADRGYYQIKIYNSMNPGWVRALAAEAHRLGMRTVGHVPAFTTADHMIEDGYDEITHINQLMLGWLLNEGEDTRTPFRVTALARAVGLDLASKPVRRTIELMHEHSVSVDTTIALLESMLLGRARTTLEADAAVLDHMPLAYQRTRRRTQLAYSSEEVLHAYEEAFTKVMDVVRLLHSEGFGLWPGTDDGMALTLHRELELFVAAGMEPADVLRIATQDCAEHIGLGHSHGRIERGKVASFVLLGGDPTRDISAVRQVRTVVKNGDVYYPSDIYTELGIRPFTEPARVEAATIGR